MSFVQVYLEEPASRIDCSIGSVVLGTIHTSNPVLKASCCASTGSIIIVIWMMLASVMLLKTRLLNYSLHHDHLELGTQCISSSIVCRIFRCFFNGPKVFSRHGVAFETNMKLMGCLVKSNWDGFGAPQKNTSKWTQPQCSNHPPAWLAYANSDSPPRPQSPKQARQNFRATPYSFASEATHRNADWSHYSKISTIDVLHVLCNWAVTKQSDSRQVKKIQVYL